jgi:hypothetical protein
MHTHLRKRTAARRQEQHKHPAAHLRHPLQRRQHMQHLPVSHAYIQPGFSQVTPWRMFMCALIKLKFCFDSSVIHTCVRKHDMHLYTYYTQGCILYTSAAFARSRRSSTALSWPLSTLGFFCACIKTQNEFLMPFACTQSVDCCAEKE